MAYNKEKEIKVNTKQDLRYQKIAMEALRRADDMLIAREEEIQIPNTKKSDKGENRWQRAIKDATFKRDAEAAYRAQLEGRSYLKIPYIYSYIRGKTADEVDTIPYPRVIGKEYRDMNTAFLFQKIMDHVINDVLDFKNLITQLYMTQKNVYGDGFLKFFWSEEKETYKKYKKVNNKVKLNKDDEPEFEEFDVVTYKNIKAEIIPIENLLLDTTIRQSGKTIRDAKRAGIYYYMLEKDFKAAFKNKEGFFNLDLVVGGGTRNIVPDEILHKRTTIDDSWVEIYESWDLYEDKHVFIANTVTIFCDACPYWNPINKQKYIPITQFVDNVAPLGMYNYGEPDVLHDITDEKIVQKQINLDTAKYSGGMLFFDDMADLDIDAIQWRHGGVARANDPQNSIHAVNIGSNFQLPFQNAGSLQDDETIVSGHDVTGIIGGATGESATKTLERKESSMKITRFTNSYNEMNGFAQSYQIVKNLILQFYTKEEFKNIAGPEGEALYMEAKENAKLLKQDYDISIVANNQIPATREIRKLRNQEVFGIMSQIQVDENGLVPAHLRPMFRQVLLDAEQPEDVIEQVLGEPATEMNVDDADSDEARAAIEAFGLNPDDFLGSGGKERKVNRSGSQKNPVENQARTDIQKISQNVSKF